MPISQQVVGGNSCGACAASYVLWERNHQNDVLTRDKISDLYEAVKFDRARGREPLVSVSGVTIQCDHTDPIKLTKELRERYELSADAYLNSGSGLCSPQILSVLSKEIKIIYEEGMDQIVSGDRLAIGIYYVPQYGGLHYILTKYEGSRYSIMDSNAVRPIFVPYSPSLSAPWTTDVFTSDGKSTKVTYQYLGGCIVVHV